MSIVQNATNSFVKAEPVIAAHTAAAVVAYVLSALVTHGVITGDQASTLTQQVVPAVSAVFLLILGALVRRVAAPVTKIAEQAENYLDSVLAGAPDVSAILSGWEAIAPATGRVVTPETTPVSP